MDSFVNIVAPLAGALAGFIFGTWVSFRIWRRATEVLPGGWVEGIPPARLRVIGLRDDRHYIDVYWGQATPETSKPHRDSWRVEGWRWNADDTLLTKDEQPTHWIELPPLSNLP